MGAVWAWAYCEQDASDKGQVGGFEAQSRAVASASRPSRCTSASRRDINRRQQSHHRQPDSTATTATAAVIATPSSRQQGAYCHVSRCLCKLRALHHLTHHHRNTNTLPAQVTNIAIPPPPPIPFLTTALESPSTPRRRSPPSNPASRSSSARNTSPHVRAQAAERCTTSQPRKSSILRMKSSASTAGAHLSRMCRLTSSTSIQKMARSRSGSVRSCA